MGNSRTRVQEKIDIIACPVEVSKAIKNETEIQGFRNAYLRDGAATVSSSFHYKRARSLTAMDYRCDG